MGFPKSQILAYMLDSLVRVSRRVGSSHLELQNHKHFNDLMGEQHCK